MTMHIYFFSAVRCIPNYNVNSIMYLNSVLEDILIYNAIKHDIPKNIY